jgi:hypothetical protein
MDDARVCHKLINNFKRRYPSSMKFWKKYVVGRQVSLDLRYHGYR